MPGPLNGADGTFQRHPPDGTLHTAIQEAGQGRRRHSQMSDEPETAHMQAGGRTAGRGGRLRVSREDCRPEGTRMARGRQQVQFDGFANLRTRTTGSR